jgi:hypothetical protein
VSALVDVDSAARLPDGSLLAWRARLQGCDATALGRHMIGMTTGDEADDLIRARILADLDRRRGRRERLRRVRADLNRRRRYAKQRSNAEQAGAPSDR